MTDRIFIIHGWADGPDSGWFPVVQRELSARKFVVTVPHMPHPDEPQIDEWVETLQHVVGQPDEHTHFIGHSVGCQAIQRYLQTLPLDLKVGKLVFVAPWYTLTLSDPAEQTIAQPWLKEPIDYNRIRRMASAITVILSDNDPYVPYQENKQLFAQRLQPKFITLYNKRHIAGYDGINDLPEVVAEFNFPSSS